MTNEKLGKLLHAAEKYGADAVCEIVKSIIRIAGA